MKVKKNKKTKKKIRERIDCKLQDIYQTVETSN